HADGLRAHSHGRDPPNARGTARGLSLAHTAGRAWRSTTVWVGGREMLQRKAAVVICGAGIVGLTMARELVRRGASDIVLLEKEGQLGRHASGRNSGVLHAGVYYPAETLKAKLCLQGNRLLKAYCREHGLPLLETGTVIVLRTESERDR